MFYAEIAINVPVRQTFHYHIPHPLDGRLRSGHLVRVAFGTAKQPGIVIAIHPTSPVEQTKSVEARLDPEPVVTPTQIALAQWMAEAFLAPLGACLWLMLPPGLVGKSDRLIQLIDDAQMPDAPLARQIVEALKRRGDLRLTQLQTTIKSDKLDATVKWLIDSGVLEAEPVLSPPSVKPKTIQTARLLLHATQISDVVRFIGRKSRRADLLAAVADFTRIEPSVDVQTVVRAAGSTKTTLDKLADEDSFITIDGDRVSLTIPREQVDDAIIQLREAETDLHILRVLSRESEPVEVSWVYAQTGAKLGDLKRLADLEFIALGERHTWRDSLAERDFVPVRAPNLTPAQADVWHVLHAALHPSPNPLPVNGEGATENDADSRVNVSPQNVESLPNDDVLGSSARYERRGQWRTSRDLWLRMKDLAREKRRQPTKAEDTLWQRVRRNQILGLPFRRQHTIERFIVDFICPQAKLIVEVDGEIHQRQVHEDAIRQEYLEALGYTVLRFTNHDVLTDIDAVIEQLSSIVTSKLNERPQTPQNKVPSPLTGRGQQATDVSPKLAGEGSSSSTYLLHGVTGSGKTEIYLQAIAATLAQGRQAMFLVPEIALTAQTVRRVAARFPGQVAVVHSRLSEGERYDTWRRARQGEISVVVGPRSALFTPFPDVGLIVLDEEHDPSYKALSSPYYHTRQVAERMAELNNAVVILGSATPDVETFYRAERGDIGFLSLPDRIMGHRERITQQVTREGVQTRYQSISDDTLTIDLPPVEIVDMRLELADGNTSIFSRALIEALDETLRRREQAILFLNRRGMATYVFCRDCGHIETCPRCDNTLTQHAHEAKLTCHHCGYSKAVPTVCPDCGSGRIKFFGAGTEHVEATFAAAYPDVRVVRWDADTASKPEMHDAILNQFLTHQADVMVGTQMVAKGWDLPLVTLVGVVSADTALGLPDFRAAERTFQLLTQVAGRAGRGLLGGKVILQTYHPDNFAIQAASGHDFLGLYDQEIEDRRDLGYPPFRRLARVVIQHTSAAHARDEAQRMADRLRQRAEHLKLTDTSFIGPAPCFFQRVNRQYRWHILIRSADPLPLLDGVDVPRGCYIDIDPVDVL